MGGLALIESDLEDARSKQEESLVIREELGAKLDAAESRLGLAEVLFEEGRFSDAQGPLRRAVEEFEKEKPSDGEVQAYETMARVLMAQEKPAEARAAIDRAVERAEKSQNHLLKMEVEITAARIRADWRESSEAMKKLESTLAEAKRIGAVGLQFKARPALGEIEMESGRSDAGRARLRELEKEAASKGFRLIARKAAAAWLTSGTR
jgi:tetratricopeptide (TPR) repeat protein